jgi:lipopolysaccharide/colanic/teichoic acid biosynthesis glycosyltransferase
MYAKFFKRLIDFTLSLAAFLFLFPILVILAIIGAIVMKGNPFFTQQRPGRIDKKTGKEKIFKLIKFRTMSNAKDKDGNLLPDAVRLNKYGRFLRSSSLDELPELLNIIKGDMAIVGPRPLVPEYLPYYTEEERHRHDVRPGLTGLAQVNGRTALSWDDRFKFDVQYVNNISLGLDIKIIFLTVKKVIVREDIVEAGQQGDFDKYRINQMKEKSETEKIK